MPQPSGLWQKFRNTPQLAAGIGILAFPQLSGIAAFHKIVTRFYFNLEHKALDTFVSSSAKTMQIQIFIDFSININLLNLLLFGNRIAD